MKPCVTLRRVHGSSHRSSRFGNGRERAQVFSGHHPKKAREFVKSKRADCGNADSRHSELISALVSALISVLWFDPLKG